MNTEKITNENLRTIDWARKDRQLFLSSIPYPKPQAEDIYLAAGLSARGVWMTDVSAMDRRSVKAQLAGRGDYRAMWWTMNTGVRRLLKPQEPLEQHMHAFHRRHHAITIAWLILRRDFLEIYDAIRDGGILAGFRTALMQCRRHSEY